MAGTTLIKQGTNTIMPVQFSGIDLDDVNSIAFIFKQGTKTRELSYPSYNAVRRDGSDDIVDIYWDEDDTWIFNNGQDIQMDTKVYFSNSDQNPYTPIVTFRIGKTLFPQSEYR